MVRARTSLILACLLMASCSSGGAIPPSAGQVADGNTGSGGDASFVDVQVPSLVMGTGGEAQSDADIPGHEDTQVPPVSGAGGQVDSGQDLGTGGVPPAPIVCVAMTCASLGASCGSISDLCGGVLQCGTCAKGQVCDPGTHTCVSQDLACGGSNGCGFVADACGNSFACSKTCGAGSRCAHNQCVACDAISCDGRCGKIPDGCGAVTDCGGCPSGQVCDALTFTCETCKKVKCTDYPTGTCGTLSDGCGATIKCACPTVPTPPPSACKLAGAKCGKIPDSCSATATVDCGGCASGQLCDGNKCVACTPTTCEAAGKNCGTMDDGCGNKLTCGTCKTNEICSSNLCKSCTPTTCEAAGKNCGTMDDGCGTKLTCGTCATNEICSSNLCKSCTPKTCTSLERACGSVSDGCGHTLTCPGCATGQVCLANGSCCQPLTCADVSGRVPDGCGGMLDCIGE